MRKATGWHTLGRGVYVAPWVGPNGELVLIALTRSKRLACDPLMVPLGGNHVAAGDELWTRLELADPMPRLQIV